METAAIIAILGFAVILTAAFYLFGSFTYDFSQDAVVVKRKIFFGIPYGQRTIRFVEIIEVRRFGNSRDWLLGAQVFGRLFFRPGVIVVTKRGLIRRIYLTPQQPDEFIQGLREAIERGA